MRINHVITPGEISDRSSGPEFIARVVINSVPGYFTCWVHNSLVGNVHGVVASHGFSLERPGYVSIFRSFVDWLGHIPKRIDSEVQFQYVLPHQGVRLNFQLGIDGRLFVQRFPLVNQAQITLLEFGTGGKWLENTDGIDLNISLSD